MNEVTSFPPRGSIGLVPALTTRAEEAFVDFLISMREAKIFADAPMIHEQANATLAASGIELDMSHACIDEAWALLREKHQDVSAWARLFKSSQTTYWRMVTASFDKRRNEILALLDEYETKGPGRLIWDPDYVHPEYARVEIHLQPGGYVDHPLAGLIYDYGAMVYKGDKAHFDKAHTDMAAKMPVPIDGVVKKIMDVGCAAGALTGALKRRFPEAEVWGSDISAPMVRYAHYRAARQGLDVNFIQKAAEDLDQLPAGEYDLVTINVLLHELPVPVLDRLIENVFRLLRPGGTFWASDFPTLGADPQSMQYTDLLSLYDVPDNCEPYAPDFIRYRFEDKMEAAGFDLRYKDPAQITRHGRVGDKQSARAT